MKLFVVLLYTLTVVLHGTAGCLHFEANPSTIHVGLTKHILLNCTFRYTADSAITNVTEISLSKSAHGVVNEIASTKRPQNVEDTSYISDLITEGYFDRDDISTLTVRWTHPALEDAGTYTCTVKGLDNIGLAHEVTETLPVAFKVTKEICPDSKPTPRKIFSIPFYPPMSFNGSFYYLSKSSTNISSEAEAFCSEYGGYLVEVDDYEELQVVYQLSKLYKIVSTLIAGTDADQEGTWIFPRTGNPVKFFNWDNGEPNNFGGDEGCRVMHFESRTDKLNDLSCQGWDLGFVCEVKETP